MSDTKETTKTTNTTVPPANTPEVKKVKIKLPKIKGETADVFVSVNNYTCVIKRGVEVEVPAFVKEVLDHQERMLDRIDRFEEQNNN